MRLDKILITKRGINFLVKVSRGFNYATLKLPPPLEDFRAVGMRRSFEDGKGGDVDEAL